MQGVRAPKPAFSLPLSWPSKIRSAMPRVVSLAPYAVISTRSWAADRSNARVRLKAENLRLHQEAAQLRAGMAIKDARRKPPLTLPASLLLVGSITSDFGERNQVVHPRAFVSNSQRTSPGRKFS